MLELPVSAMGTRPGWHDPGYLGRAARVPCGVIALAFGLDRVAGERVGPDLVNRAGWPVLDRVVALVDPGNVRSRAVCTRLGMRHLGPTGRYYGLTFELFELARAEVS